ncbi:unnamed protein product [Lathyrus oleraceus]
MSFVRNYQAEDRIFNGGYWPTYDGNNTGNTDRKRSRNHYDQRNYNNYYDNQTNDQWNYNNYYDNQINFGHRGGNLNQCNADYANYADVGPSSLKKRKFSAPDRVEIQKFNLPATIHDNVRSFQAHPTRSNAYTSASVKPGFSIFDDDTPVFMSRDDIDRNSPSRKDGIDVRHEAHLRYSYCAFLQNLGTRLELPQTTIGTSMVLCHRFFVRQSHACHDRFLIATAALFLSGKSEESPCPLNSVLRTSSEILHRQEFAFLSYWFPVDWFEQLREQVLEAEQLILTTLNFELNVRHPYAPLTSVLSKFGLSKTVLVNMALNLVSEGAIVWYSYQQCYSNSWHSNLHELLLLELASELSMASI